MHKVLGLGLALGGAVLILFSASLSPFLVTFAAVPLASATVSLSLDDHCWIRTCSTPAYATFSPTAASTDQSGRVSFSILSYSFGQGYGYFSCSGVVVQAPATFPPKLKVSVNGVPDMALIDLGSLGYTCPGGPVYQAIPPAPHIEQSIYLNPSSCPSHCLDWTPTYSNYIVLDLICQPCGGSPVATTTTTTTNQAAETVVVTTTQSTSTTASLPGNTGSTAPILTGGAGAGLIMLGAAIFLRKGGLGRK